MMNHESPQERAHDERRKRAIKHTEDARKLRFEKRKKSSGPVAYGYGRVSHFESELTDAIPAQEDRTLKFFGTNQAFIGSEWGGFIAEPGHISAYKKPFLKRPAGKLLATRLRAGDHLIVDKVDRLWRNIQDYANLIEWFRTNEINLHFVDWLGASVTLGTPMGDFILATLVMGAQLESAVKSERIKAQKAHAASQGFWCSPKVPVGCDIVGPKGRRKLVWNFQERAIMAQIVEMFDVKGYGWEKVSRKIDLQERLNSPEAIAEWNKWTVKQRSLKGRKSPFWNVCKCKRAYIREKYFVMVDDPMQANWKAIREYKGKVSQAGQIWEGKLDENGNPKK